MIKSILRQFILIVFILSIYSSNSFSQFSVLSSSPVNGTANVDTASTLSITFSAAIDTTARFLFPGNIFIELFFNPDSLVDEPDSITFSPDMHTLYFHNLHLSEFTDYRFCILNAVSVFGDSLDSPYAFSFSTNPAMSHNATVSGIVGPNPLGAMVFLFDSNPFEDDESFWGYWAVATPVTGSYTVDFVAPDFYWPVVVRNFYLDDDGDIEIQDGTELGFLDFNGDLRPDSIFVFSGSNLTGVDMTMDDIYLQTARNSLTEVNLVAQTWQADAQLVEFGGDELHPNGNSMFWQYAYYSSSTMNSKNWLVAGDMIVSVKDDSVNTDTTALPLNWLDSDSIMAVAENNGGSNFRQQYTDAQVSGGCRYLYPDWFGKKSNVNFAPFKNIESVVTSLVWRIGYDSNEYGESMELLIDAKDGTFLNPPVTAAMAEQKAAIFAHNWAMDAELWGISSQFGTIDSSGKAEFWLYNYYSSHKDSMRGVYFFGLLPIWDGTLTGISFDTTTIQPGWINSDVAMDSAEFFGGNDYRQNNQQVFTNATLGLWINGVFPDSIVWKIEYSSSTAGPLEIIIDAYSGQLITNLDKPDDPMQPISFKLYQNYPNPFNPKSNISFYIPKTAEVELKIYNLAGQEVGFVNNGKLSAGEHQINWHAGNLPSGVYFYKIQAGEFVDVKKCILMK